MRRNAVPMADGWHQFAHGRARNSGEAAESVSRKIWLLLELLRYRRVRFEDYASLHERDRRSFQRDLQQLRKIGKKSGFSISTVDTATGTVTLEKYEGGLRRLDGGGPPLLPLIAELARTLGEPIQGELSLLLESAPPEGEVFLHVLAPGLVEGSQVAKVYERLKDAWGSPNGRASVRFKYRSPRGEIAERTVDPYRVVVRSGRYYLVGYDHARRAWRMFALDSIVGLPAKAGTVGTIRPVPPEYASDDALGFMKGGRTTEVTVELSAAVVASATSRRWQAEQRVERRPGGKALLTVTVSDVGEVIRWAFGFGADACIVAPLSAVKMAREFAEELVARYRTEAELGT